MRNAFFTPFLDTTATEDLACVLKPYRQYASDHDVDPSFPILYHVREGFTRELAPTIGPCNTANIRHGKTALAIPDEPTKEGFVLWIPRLVSGATPMSRDTQTRMLADLRQHLRLPEQHLTSFGSANLLAGLILTHYALTGDNPLQSAFGCCRTDTPGASPGKHLTVFFGEGENRSTPELGFGAFDSGEPYMVQRMPFHGMFALSFLPL